MAAVLQKDWPDRKVEILASTTVICILSTAILIWRVVYGVLNKRKLLLCDYLLIVAAVLNIVTTVIRFKTTAHGLGRHILDPSIIKPRDLLDYSYELFINQIINLIAVAILKYSICSYLLALKFSTVYVVIVWASIVMVTIFNLLLPMLGNFSCTPYEANWNKGLKNKDCWYKAPLGLTYMQGVSNCVTDAVYVVAPIIYLRHIQLPRRTQWGLRVVFLLGIVATICSIFKTIELSALRKTRDPTWDGVNLTIWSATELSIGILIASLPPLRKQFDKMFRVILPSSFTTKNKTPGNSIPLYNVSKHHFSKPMGRSELDRDDGSSEHQILPADMDGKITKTVVHEITTMERETTNVMNGPVRTRESYGKMSG
ncbi:hypothetical protein P154DRAFT_618904 [Amniculicola lignicola CBS 123094]|uniref:Rhodopsin domain-containing protein n=1 Tax=Amniculicola lignicola CBS 123094 TaxID=1392246 RepID=A0A6A5WMR4_9PLEO|nr:hypothetical protein P154DRAFT_618904 [Amniculicola lignicola CBS 123094]